MFLKGLSLKSKLLFICLVPMVFVTAALLFQTTQELAKLKELEIQDTRERAIKRKEKELESITSTALSSLKLLLEEPESEARAKRIANHIDKLSYGNDGYFFVNSFDNFYIANGRAPNKYGKRLAHVGKPVFDERVKNMINLARAGGGFIQTASPKRDQPASDKKDYPKLTYITAVPQHDWYIGTGFFIDDIEQIITTKEASFDSTIRSIFYKNISMALLLLAIISFVCFIGVRKALFPLEKMNNALKDIAHGDGDLTKTLPVTNNDEVGSCAKSFNEFVAKIKGIVAHVSNETLVINESTNKLDQTSKQSFERIQMQRQKSELLATAINEMLASAQEIARNANLASESALDANKEGETTVQTLQNAVNKLHSLTADINGSSNAIFELEQETDAIGSVLEVIQQIAEQTNLLALNAAIEAARAGEQGRGFAVVADEVRTLASRTQTSTEEIKSMIDRLQSGASKAVNAMKVSQSSSNETIKEAEQAKSSLERMTQMVRTINDMNMQIATAAKEQTDVTEDLNQNVHSLSQMTEESEAEIETISDTSAQLKSNASSLTNEMSSFSI